MDEILELQDERLFFEFVYCDVWFRDYTGKNTREEIQSFYPSLRIEFNVGDYGAAVIRREEESSFWDGLGNLIEGYAGFHNDILQASIYVLNAPVNTIINDTIFTPKFNTEIGAALGGAAIMWTDAQHIAGKEFARVVSGGLVDKALDTIRLDKNKVANVGDQYAFDMTGNPWESFSGGFYDFMEDLGAAYGKQVSQDLGLGGGGDVPPPTVPPPTVFGGSFMTYVILAVVAFFVLMSPTKK